MTNTTFSNPLRSRSTRIRNSHISVMRLYRLGLLWLIMQIHFHILTLHPSPSEMVQTCSKIFNLFCRIRKLETNLTFQQIQKAQYQQFNFAFFNQRLYSPFSTSCIPYPCNCKPFFVIKKNIYLSSNLITTNIWNITHHEELLSFLLNKLSLTSFTNRVPLTAY